MPATAHRAFDDYDMMWQILGYLSPSAYIEDGELCIIGDRTMLARCARVSQNMSRPALDLLWRNLPSLSPLLSLSESHSARNAKDFLMEKPKAKKSRLANGNVCTPPVGVYLVDH